MISHLQACGRYFGAHIIVNQVSHSPYFVLLFIKYISSLWASCTFIGTKKIAVFDLHAHSKLRMVAPKNARFSVWLGSNKQTMIKAIKGTRLMDSCATTTHIRRISILPLSFNVAAPAATWLLMSLFIIICNTK